VLGVLPFRRLEHRPATPVVLLGNQNWRSNGSDGEDRDELRGLAAQLRSTAADPQDSLDDPDGPPEPLITRIPLKGSANTQAWSDLCGHDNASERRKKGTIRV
jgi:hypothetical protein